MNSARELCFSLFLPLWGLSSVAQSCLTLCDLVDCSTPGLPVLYYLLELAQTHVHWVGDAIQPSHPLSPSSPSTLHPHRSSQTLRKPFSLMGSQWHSLLLLFFSDLWHVHTRLPFEAPSYTTCNWIASFAKSDLFSQIISRLRVLSFHFHILCTSYCLGQCSAHCGLLF